MYIDANVIVHAALDSSWKGDIARELLQRTDSRKCPAEISALVMDEVLWVIQKKRGRGAAESFGRLMLWMPFIWLDAGYTSARAAIEYYQAGLDPRDAFHAGIMRHHGLHEIASEDSHFDNLKDIRRKGIREAYNEI